MRFNVIIRYIGLVLLLNAVFMLLSAFISLFNDMDTAFYPLLMSFILTTALGAFPLIFVSADNKISTKEGYMIVVGSWLLSCLAGMVPYVLWGGEFDLVNSWFESASGYTTTGATILQNVEALPKGLLFWRSSTHWLGGVGVVMFTLLILPALGRARMKLSSVELSTLAKENYKYKSKKIVQILLVVYVGLTFAETILLKIVGMDWFDAVNHSFSTIATGGFSTRNLSIMSYDNVWIEIVISIFMALAGMHFGLIYATLIGKRKNLFSSEITRFYIGSMVIAGAVIGVSLYIANIYPSILSSLRYALFQVISVTTTTGFATANSNLWTPLAIMLLIYLSIQCACAGSTAGGIKCDRLLLGVKTFRAKIKQQQHPNAIIRIKLNNIVQENAIMSAATLFIVMYLILIAVFTIFNTLFGVDLMTSFSVAFSCIGNVGPGFGGIGSLDNYSALPDIVKSASTFLMLLGRLEIFGFLQFFLISSWK